ncbi:MAG: gliding motility protein [Archangium gephyra]|uniref:Gliding motility protein n=1 Tax=Archangium gephyra TaxID=48 RepID=A0A2W5TYE6_9BACT|nr:MAG: gliding motility protein [Archangium gephyra]
MKSIRIAAMVVAGSTVVGCTTVKEEVKPDVVVAPPKPVEKSSKELFADSVKAFDAGKLDEAKEGFSKVAARAPNNAVVQYNLGVIAERQGKLTEAAGFYETAHKLDPKHKGTLLNLGRVYRLQDKFDAAIALYEGALKDPANEFDVELNNNLTVAYRLAKKYAQAEATARKVLARTKDNPDAYKNLSLIYFDQGNYRLAEFISANAKKLDDKDPGVYNNLGLIYLKLDERRAALGQFQKAVSLNKDFAPSLFNIGAMSLAYRDYEGAEKVLSRATELDPTSYEGFLAYAWALDGQKGRDAKKGLKAGENFERVLAIKNDQSDAVCGAGWAYSADKAGWDKAIAYLEKCKTLSTTSATDQQLIDSKVKGIVAMQKAGAAAAQPKPEEKEKPKAAPTNGPSLLDKVSDDAAKADPGAATEQPATGGTPPAEGAAPAPAPAPAPEKPKS